MDPVAVPPKFIDLTTFYQTQGREVQCNVIGTCVDFLAATKSQGSDYTRKFVLHDPTWSDTLGADGLNFRFFNKDLKGVPDIQDQGDVVLLRNVKMKDFNGWIGISNRATSWVVLPFTELSKIHNVSDLKTKARWLDQPGSTHDSDSNLPSDAELQYAKWISEQEDPKSWTRLQGATHLEISNTMKDSGGVPPKDKPRYVEIQDLQPPEHGKLLFVELLGEVRKKYSWDNRMEISITDYTTNPLLWDYQYGDDEDEVDGDPYNYTHKEVRKWPGPWGRMTLSVLLWDAHFAYAARNVEEGSFVYLKNVQIKLDGNGSKLDGVCRGDRRAPSEVNVEVRTGKDAGRDQRMRQLLMRKREYEAKAKAENIYLGIGQKRSLPIEDASNGNRKKARVRTRGRNKKETRSNATGAEDATTTKENSNFESNTNVRCFNVDVPVKPIKDILDPANLQRKTILGNTFSVPFQNCKYKSKVRVVDYFPKHLVDFAVFDERTQLDVLDRGPGDGSDNGASQEEVDGIKWEWRFLLLVEDAKPQKSDDGSPVQMELLVADKDAEHLLNMPACDLRDEENAGQLSKLQEKLFHLWGDLQERKEELNTAEALSVKPQNRPFECLIMEYGIPVRKNGDCSQDHVEYQRMFRMFGTTA
jgi:hypothetical protein